MKYNIIKVYHGQLVDNDKRYTLIQVCEKCSLSPSEIIEMVDEGIIQPMGRRKIKWLFSHESVERMRKAIRLRRELELNIAGVALAINLLDRIKELESQLSKLKT